jgi:gliding motility-associated-like protein
MSPTVVFDDVDVDTDLRSYTYRVLVEDSCGTETLLSNEGTTIRLVADPGIDGVNRLRWNGYAQWAGNVSGFTIFRSVADGPFLPIGVTGASDWEYDDDVNALVGSNGRFCYYIYANEVSNPSGLNATSTSNVACAIQQEAVWIPNAFIAGGFNDVFRPVPAFVDVNGYELEIFNRWGQSIWRTTDRTVGWDGRVDGYYVPQGVYAYYCAFLNGAGKKFEERGSVTFLCCP